MLAGYNINERPPLRGVTNLIQRLDPTGRFFSLLIYPKILRPYGTFLYQDKRN
jgi:hypothetical protein